MDSDIFQKEKKQFLEKPDKSRKGGIDQKISSLLDVINGSDEYYSTSSCSGRITVMQRGEKKCDAQWFFSSHDIITESKELFSVIDELKENEDAVFTCEGAILHVRCKDADAATKLLTASRNAGFKLAGIISTQKWIVEIRCAETLIVPVGCIDNKELLLHKSNMLLKKTWSKIDTLYVALKQ